MPDRTDAVELGAVVDELTATVEELETRAREVRQPDASDVLLLRRLLLADHALARAQDALEDADPADGPATPPA